MTIEIDDAERSCPTALAFIAIEEGISAARRGDPCSATPYPLDTQPGRRWRDGWMQAFIAMARGEHLGFGKELPD